MLKDFYENIKKRFTKKNVMEEYEDEYPKSYYAAGQVSYGLRPDRIRTTRGNERTIINAIYNRIGIDCAAISIKHVTIDDNDRFTDVVNSGLNYCLNMEANIDQSGQAFVQDMVMTLLDEGVVAIVPVDVKEDSITGELLDIDTVRVAKIIEWYPQQVRIKMYDDRTGRFEEILIPKRKIAILENPMFSILNEPNSTMKRLVRKLVLLDAVDEQMASGKLNMIIQLPYSVRGEKRETQAKNRRDEMERQLVNSKHGIAYTDGTEKIIQLNRPIDNNLLATIEYLTKSLLTQIGITENMLNGSADEVENLNYNNHILEPILSTITNNFNRSFLSREQQADNQRYQFFRNPFKLVPVNQIAELSDKLTRNEIMTSNEVRQIIGLKRSTDPSADELRNKNLSQSSEVLEKKKDGSETIVEEKNQNGGDKDDTKR